MQAYYGTKLVYARSMTRAEYNSYRGWELPANENGSDLGVLVEYTDKGSISNHENHEGYISWSPLDVFSLSYQPLDRLSFGHAIEALESGERVRREGWNGKGMWLTMIDGDVDVLPEAHRRDYRIRDDSDDDHTTGLRLLPWIGMKTADDKFVPWLASQTDMLAKDWQVVADDE